MKRIFIDTRWDGNFGIGRYSREIIQRLDKKECNYITGKIPTKFTEILKRHTLPQNSLFYSPGFVPLNSNCKQVITIHDLIQLERDFQKIKDRFYFKSYLLPRIKSGQIIVNTVSKTSAEKIGAWSDIELKNILIAPNGLSKDILEAGARVTVEDREKRILFVGNSKWHKNADFFFNSIGYLAQDWIIDVVASDLDVPRYLTPRRIKVYKNLSDSELVELYLKSSVLAITSLYEGFGMPVLEGAYLGNKIISLHDLPSVREIIGDRFASGNNCNPEDFASLIENVHVCNNPISEMDRRQLPNTFSWEMTAQLIEGQLQRI